MGRPMLFQHIVAKNLPKEEHKVVPQESSPNDSAQVSSSLTSENDLKKSAKSLKSKDGYIGANLSVSSINFSRLDFLLDVLSMEKALFFTAHLPFNRYPPGQTELENLLSQANQDREITIECGNQLANKCSVLDKDNKHIQHNLKQSNKDKKKLSKLAYQLIEEIKQLSSELDNELASKINEIEYLGALCLASQKTKDILDPVVMGG
ncbi:36535_t:CDS:2, partial [Gigaspora margarita]